MAMNKQHQTSYISSFDEIVCGNTSSVDSRVYADNQTIVNATDGYGKAWAAGLQTMLHATRQLPAADMAFAVSKS
jgi:hypothetical protein